MLHLEVNYSELHLVALELAAVPTVALLKATAEDATQAVCATFED